MSTGNFDSAMTLQDKIRLRLGEYGQKHVPLTPSDLAAELRTEPYSVYQALYRLKSLGEIEIEKDDLDKKIVGVKIIKLEPSNRTYQRTADRAKAAISKNKEIPIKDTKMVALQNYLNQKLAVMDMQKKAEEAGLNPEDTVKFEPNPYAEEGILLLQLMTDAFKEIKECKDKIKMLEFDLEAERRNVQYLKESKRENTRRELLASTA